MEGPGAVGVLGLEEAGESGVDAVDGGFLVRFEDVAPVFGAFGVFVVVGGFAHPLRHFGDAEVVVGVLDGAGNAPGVGAETNVVDVVDWDVVQVMPTGKATTTFDIPVWRFDFCVGNNGRIAGPPVHTLIDALEIAVDKHHVGVGSSLSEAFAKRHSAVW